MWIESLEQIERIDSSESNRTVFTKSLHKLQASNRSLIVQGGIEHVDVYGSQTCRLGDDVLAEACLRVQDGLKSLPQAELFALKDDELIEFAAILKCPLKSAVGDALVKLR